MLYAIAMGQIIIVNYAADLYVSFILALQNTWKYSYLIKVANVINVYCTF